MSISFSLLAEKLCLIVNKASSIMAAIATIEAAHLAATIHLATTVDGADKDALEAAVDSMATALTTLKGAATRAATAAALAAIAAVTAPEVASAVPPAASGALSSSSSARITLTMTPPFDGALGSDVDDFLDRYEATFTSLEWDDN